MIDQEIKIKLLELALNRKNLTAITTLQCLKICECYLNGENLKVLETDVNFWIKEELNKKIKHFEQEQLSKKQLSKKNEKDKSLFEKVFGI